MVAHMSNMLLELCSTQTRLMWTCFKLLIFLYFWNSMKNLHASSCCLNSKETHIFRRTSWGKKTTSTKWWLTRKFTTLLSGDRVFWTRFCPNFTGKHHTHLVIKVSYKIRKCYLNSYQHSTTHFRIVV